MKVIENKKVYFFLTLIVLGMIGWLVNLSILEIKKRHEKQSIEILDNLVKTSVISLKNIWLKDIQRDIENHLSTLNLDQHVKQLLPIAHEQNALLAHPSQKQVKLLSSELLGTYYAKGVEILTPDGIVITSNFVENIGTKTPITDYYPERLKKVFEGKAQFIPSITLRIPIISNHKEHKEHYSAMFIAVPIFDSSHNVTAAFVVYLDPYENLNEILEAVRYSQTGETYLFDRSARLISGNRFEDELIDNHRLHKGEDALLKVEIRNPYGKVNEDGKQPLTFMAQKALSGQSGHSIESYIDYRGKKVFGSWIWDNDLQIGFVSEIDEEEVLKNFYPSRNLIIGGFLSTFILISLFYFLVSRIQRSAHQKLEESDLFLRTLMEKAVEGIISINEDGEIIAFNTAAERMTGYSKTEAIGHNVSMLMSEPYRSAHNQYVKEYLRTGIAHIIGVTREVEIVRQDGSSFVAVLGVSEIRLAEKIIFTAIIHDLSEQKAVEDELLKAKETAELAVKAKSYFIANISHEIRTPMNSILGMSYLALKYDLEPKLHGYLVSLNNSAKALTIIINDILDFSNLDSEKMKLESIPFYLGDVFRDLSNSIGVLAQEKGVILNMYLEANVPKALIGDPKNLKRILLNLLNNAVKFTHKGGEVSLSMKLEQEDDHSAVIHFMIQDNGIGMNEEEQKSLFTSFSQGDGSSTRKFGGIGLGLTITKQLVERMEGAIWVKSAEKEGSTFHVTVRMQKQSLQKPLEELSMPMNLTVHTSQQMEDANFEPVDSEQFYSLTAELKSILEESDTKAVEVFESLKKAAGTHYVTENLRELGNAVQRYDFDTALEILETIINQNSAE